MEDAGTKDAVSSSVRYYNDHGRLWAGFENDHAPDDWTWAMRNMAGFGPLMLDIGCGTARAYNALASMNIGRYIGVDASKTMVEIARERFPGADFRVGDILRLKEAVPELCDAFLCCSMLMQVPRECMGQALRCVRSVLRPGAAGYLATPSGERVGFLTHELRPGRIPEGYSVLLQQWLLGDLCDILRDSGFGIVEELDDGHMLNILVRAA